VSDEEGDATLARFHAFRHHRHRHGMIEEISFPRAVFQQFIWTGGGLQLVIRFSAIPIVAHTPGTQADI